MLLLTVTLVTNSQMDSGSFYLLRISQRKKTHSFAIISVCELSEHFWENNSSNIHTLLTVFSFRKGFTIANIVPNMEGSLTTCSPLILIGNASFKHTKISSQSLKLVLNLLYIPLLSVAINLIKSDTASNITCETAFMRCSIWMCQVHIVLTI